MIRIAAREGQPLNVDAATAQVVRRRLAALEDELEPTLPFLRGDAEFPTIQNLVGSVQISSNLVLDIEPKTEPGQNWAAALIDLLVDESVHFGGETAQAELAPRTLLADAFARMYAQQLDRAVRREGPLAVIRHRHMSRPRLAGRLNVTRWMTQQITRPHVFPQLESHLTIDNEFTAAMHWVAEALAVRCTDPRIASRLRSIAARLRPGLPEHSYVDPGVAHRSLPPQWRAYAPAWTTACAVLRRISPVHRSGVLEGFGLAIEPWPLLERLLHRALHSAALQARDEGWLLRAVGQSRHPLLTPETPAGEVPALDRILTPRRVEPDGTLWLGDEIIANFEAKYSVASPRTTRDHIFQVMTTAAALDSPLAMLVYPELSEPVTWTTHGFDGQPARLVALGLDMYGYRRGAGDRERGAAILGLVKAARASTDEVDPVAFV